MSADTNFTEQLRVACNAPAKDYSLHPAETIMLYWAAEMVLLLAICLEDSFYWCSLQPNADTSSEALAILTVPLIHDMCSELQNIRDTAAAAARVRGSMEKRVPHIH